MMKHVGVFRIEEGMHQAVEKIRELQREFQNVGVDDQGQHFNTDILEALQTENLLDLAEVIALGALARTESRGAHARDDFKKRDDENWLQHTLAFRQPDGEIDLRYKPVVITQHQPKERVY
jgi:succinate dehydrogenase / fumarate reductase flavoprotein subunit